MKWRRRPRSKDLVDRRGAPRLGGGGIGPIAIGGGIGLPALLVLAVIFFLNSGSGGGTGTSIDNPLDDIDFGAPREAPLQGPDPDKNLVNFLSFVLDDVQNFWSDTLAHADRPYRRAKLVLFEGQTSSACGGATEDIGPHYCPADEYVYIDLGFFRELHNRFDAPGDFAQAYVLAHEIAHHVQNVMGISGDVSGQQRTNPDRANDLSIRLELQADCLAGVWAFTTFERNLLESGDLEEGLNAAAAVGDDRIQSQVTGRIDRETWTHGSSEQRANWFKAGYEDGDPNDCDTFSVSNP